MGISFGFMLLDTEKSIVRHWYVDEHLTRTTQNKDILHQVPNLFSIKTKMMQIRLLKNYTSKIISILFGGCFILIVCIYCVLLT